jgi:hypothetical protein
MRATATAGGRVRRCNAGRRDVTSAARSKSHSIKSRVVELEREGNIVRAGRVAQHFRILLFAALAIALSIHAVPGVGQVTSPASSVNVGKVSVGLLQFALRVQRVSSTADVRRFWKPTLAIGVVRTAVTAGAAVATGYVRFEPKLPPGTAVTLVSNLLFTCIAEESFFRGLPQEEIHRVAER